MNKVELVGNIGGEPELRYTPNGAAVTSFSIALNERYKDEQGNWQDGETTWVDVKAWREMAESVSELAKGTRVIVTGKLTVESWETNEGETRRKTVIVADEIGPSLRFATATVERRERS